MFFCPPTWKRLTFGTDPNLDPGISPLLGGTKLDTWHHNSYQTKNLKKNKQTNLLGMRGIYSIGRAISSWTQSHKADPPVSQVVDRPFRAASCFSKTNYIWQQCINTCMAKGSDTIHISMCPTTKSKINVWCCRNLIKQPPRVEERVAFVSQYFNFRHWSC